MHDNPSNGYTIELEKLMVAIPENHHKEFVEIIENGVEEEILDFLEEYLPTNLPQPEGIYTLGEEDHSDDLEQGVPYAIFSEFDLFEKKPTKEYTQMKEIIGEVQDSSWTTWG